MSTLQTAFIDILDKRNHRQQFGFVPFLFQHDDAPVHKEKCLFFSVSQWKDSTDLHPTLTSALIQHFWDEMER